MLRGADECNALIADVMAAQLPKAGTGASNAFPVFETCPYLNISLCSATEANNVSSCSTGVL